MVFEKELRRECVREFAVDVGLVPGRDADRDAILEPGRDAEADWCRDDGREPTFLKSSESDSTTVLDAGRDRVLAGAGREADRSSPSI